MNSKIVFPDVIRRNLSVVEVILVVLQTARLCRLPCGHLTVFEGRKNNDAATSAFGDGIVAVLMTKESGQQSLHPLS